VRWETRKIKIMLMKKPGSKGEIEVLNRGQEPETTAPDKIPAQAPNLLIRFA